MLIVLALRDHVILCYHHARHMLKRIMLKKQHPYTFQNIVEKWG